MAVRRKDRGCWEKAVLLFVERWTGVGMRRPLMLCGFCAPGRLSHAGGKRELESKRDPRGEEDARSSLRKIQRQNTEVSTGYT